jgi:hypothetical protein
MKCAHGCEHAAVLTQWGALCMRHYVTHRGNLAIAKVLDRDQWGAHLRQVEANVAAEKAMKGSRS